ncbi:hypothetical protein [Streptomyces sp. NBC_00984]|uniref:hypothetical protein n=1 Tax=Streptomyces sp. NBC_00984 TaxID=2903700 RepID=UPI002F910B28
MTTVGEVVHLVDVVTGSAATLTPADGAWEVHEGGPVRMWRRLGDVLDAYEAAGAPGAQRRSPCTCTTAGSTCGIRR